MGTNSGNNDTSLLDKLTPLLGLNIPIFLLSPTKAREEMQSKTFDEVKLYKRLDIADLFPEQIEASYSYNRFGSSYYGKIILVTGAGGTIGSAFAKELFYSGVKATLILLDYSEKALSEIVTFMKNSDNLKIVPKLLDLKEKKSVEKIFENYKVSLVMHAAGNNFPESLNENISKVMQENLTTTKILADISNKAGIQKFIFCSTAGARHPRTTLEVSKRLAEIYLLSLNKNSNGTNFISVRLQCVYDSSGSGIGYLENQIAYNKPIDRSIFSEYELYSNKKDVAKALLLVANENTHFAQVALTLRLGFLVKTKVVANVVLNTKLSNTQKNIKIKVEYKNSFKNSSLGVNQVSNLESISLDKLFIEEKGLESNYSKSQIQQKIENLCINLLFDQNDISLIFDLIKDFNSNQWENLFKLQQEKSVPGKVIKLQSK
jgi:hypothetical protein